MPYPIKQKYFKTYDGTKIGYQVVGKGKDVIVLCNGLGGSMIAWSPIYNKFGDRFKFIAWDYRGLFTSEPPTDLEHITIEHHSRDLEELLKVENINKAVFGGWSMGVQVALEYFRNHANQYRGIFLINGTSGTPYNTALNSSLTKYIVPNLNALLKKAMPKLQPHIQPLAEMVINSKDFIKIVSKLGMIHENLDSELFKEVAHGMMKTDLTMFHHILDHLNDHDASDVLAKIKVPTLIIAGTKDIMTPSKVAVKMAEKIKKAELFIVNNGSHYSLLEFPDIITKRLEQFLYEYFSQSPPL